MNEDMILPADYQEETATPQAEDNIDTAETEVVENTNDTTEVQEQTETVEQPQEQPKIRIKYNHEERELTLEEATLLAQKGMNYDKTIEKLKSLETDPRLSFVEQQAKKYNMTPQEYIEAVKKQEEQEQLNELIQQNIPEEYAREMLENRKFREQFQAKEQEKQQQAKEEAEINEFIDSYPDVKIDAVPKEVWEYRNKTGKSLTDSMFWHENQQLKNKIKVLEQNLSNKSKAPVSSITSHGSTEVAAEDDFLAGFNSY